MKALFSTLIFSCFALFAHAQTSYISSDTDIYLKEGGLVAVASPDILVRGTYDPFSNTWLVGLSLKISGAKVPTSEVFTRIDAATVDIYCTCVDAIDVQNALEQAVIDVYLTAITGNGSTTFTIH
jgi:hypothetical protein